VEQGTDSLSRECCKLSLHDLSCREFGISCNRRITTDLVEDFLRKPGGRSVFVSHSMDNGNSLSLTTSGEEELGRLVEMEEEESGKEHHECEGAHSVDKISPSLIDRVA